MIPKRFVGECEFCHEPVDVRAPGVHVLVEGWIENRTGGGAHGIRLAKRSVRYACKFCVDRRAQGTDLDQLQLFQ